MPKPLVLVTNLGTPAAPTPPAVRAFLAEFLADPFVVDLPSWFWRPLLHGVVLRRRPRRVARQYRAIWTAEGLPLDRGTRRIAGALQALLGNRAEVRIAYRYGTPALHDELLRCDRDRPILVLPLFPQPTGATSGTIEAMARRTIEAAGAGRDVSVRAPQPDAPGYVAALAARCREGFARDEERPDWLAVSFHGIPERQDRRERGRYRAACKRTYGALLDALSWPADRATLCYQSKFGPGRWLEPMTSGLLATLPERGVRDVAVVCPGFLTEGLETLEEIGLRGARTFIAAGGRRLRLIRAVEDHPALIGELARLVTGA